MVTKLEKKPQKTSKMTKAAKTAKKAAKTETAPEAPKDDVSKEATAKEDAPKLTSNITIEQMADSYLRHLEGKGKTVKTVSSYGIDLKLAQKVLGADTKVASLTPKQVQEFFDSDRVTKRRDGQPKAKPGVDKTRRAFRMAVEWLQEVGVIDNAPIPEKPEKPKKADKAEPKK